MMRANGFTLIELLVAMTAGALLLAGMSWIVMQLGRQSKDVRSARDAVQLSAALDRVRALVEGARAGPTDRIELATRRLAFTTNPPMSLGQIGLVEADLRVTSAKDGEALTLGLRDGDGRALLGKSPSRLLAGQKSIRFSWLEDRSIGEKGHGAVRVHIIDQANRPTDLIVPVAVTGDPKCVFDPISLTCR
jgi:prepilin-type N-terminal cleavage/methylation domain-containing protein